MYTTIGYLTCGNNYPQRCFPVTSQAIRAVDVIRKGNAGAVLAMDIAGEIESVRALPTYRQLIR